MNPLSRGVYLVIITATTTTYHNALATLVILHLPTDSFDPLTTRHITTSTSTSR